jgi:hypothetical protein
MQQIVGRLFSQVNEPRTASGVRKKTACPYSRKRIEAIRSAKVE